MKTGVVHKLFVVILAATGLSVISAVAIMQWNLNRGFLKFVNTVEQSSVTNLATELEEFYRTEQDWKPLIQDRQQWNHLVEASFPHNGQPPEERRPHPGSEPDRNGPAGPPPDRMAGGNHGPRYRHHVPHHFIQRLSLLDSRKQVIIGQEKGTSGETTFTPLTYRGGIVGFIGLLPRESISDDRQLRFLREQKVSLVMTAVVVLLLAATLSILVAHRLVRPLKQMIAATRQLAAGSFAARVPVESKDELGQLAQDFNGLAATLGQSELTRRQWIADISHELRTPLAILRSEIESIQDGIRQPTTERINSLHAETLHLARIVDDLYQLSLSDVGGLTYRKVGINLTEVLKETVTQFYEKLRVKNIRVEEQYPETEEVPYCGDRERLRQLFANLLENAQKYTDVGGELHIALQVTDRDVIIDFSDSAPHVPTTELDRLFERLYRVESSRNRATGGAGLGLAICRNIVEAHNGVITASTSPLGGLWIRIRLPGVIS